MKPDIGTRVRLKSFYVMTRYDYINGNHKHVITKRKGLFLRGYWFQHSDGYWAHDCAWIDSGRRGTVVTGSDHPGSVVGEVWVKWDGITGDYTIHEMDLEPLSLLELMVDGLGQDKDKV